MMGVLVFILFILLALAGLPLFLTIGLATLYLFFQAGEELSILGIEIYKLAHAPTLISIPLFTLAGYLMAESGSPARLVRFAKASLGWLPGGVALACLTICAFFTAFTGASGVTIIALGGLLYPILHEQGYRDDFNYGLITTSGSLGLLFPPSLPIILYGLVGKVDIDQLFKAGFIPGILLILILGAFSLLKGQGANFKRIPFSGKELWLSFKGAAWEVVLPIGVLVGIYGGYTTPTEAASLTALYVVVMECFIYREVSLTRKLPSVMIESMTLVGAILIILCCALGFTNYLVDEEIPMKILEMMKGFVTNKYTFLIGLNLFLLVVGALMDIFSAIVVVVPLIIPISREFGIDPIHLAVIFLTNLEIGYITPPVGINLFISSSRFNKTMPQLYRYSFPFLIVMLFALALITYIPALSLALL